jgi:predicted flap endonuclease-1-like 5' DNA nuclease
MPAELTFLLISLVGAFGIGILTAWLQGRSKREELRKELENTSLKLDRSLDEMSRLNDRLQELGDQLEGSVDIRLYDELKRKFRSLEREKQELERRISLGIAEDPSDPGEQKLMMEELGLSLFHEVPPEEKDPLNKINGISLFVEERLNAIGIRSFQQLAKLSEQQVKLLNETLELLPGRILREDWVGQSQKLIDSQEDSKKKLETR